MSKQRLWRDDIDAKLKAMRAEGASWSEVSAAIGISRNACFMRGKELKVPTPFRNTAGKIPALVTMTSEIIIRQDRDPFPAGHPETWAAITMGTVLEGSIYG